MKNNHVPMRTCVGCRQTRPKKELIRIVDGENGIAVDPAGKMNGRGVYVCPDEECMYAAVKNNGFKRSLKKNIDKETIERLAEELMQYGQENS